MRNVLLILGTAVMTCTAGCGEEGESASFGGRSGAAPTEQGDPGEGHFGDGLGTGGTAAGAPGSAADPLPPEEEIDIHFELPQAGERFVYAVNPESNTVAVVDAETLAIHTVEAGREPRFLQTLAGTDSAVVLNVTSADATLIRTTAAGSRTSRVEVLRGSNAIAVAADGRHAVVYYDDRFSERAHAGSFQDVTVIRLGDDGDAATGVTVGFRPNAVVFSEDGDRGFVVTEDGVSILDFDAIEASGPGIAPTVSLGTTPGERALDVAVTPDGRYALAREQNDTRLRLVELATGGIQTLDFADVQYTIVGGNGDGAAPDAGAEGGEDAGTAEGGSGDPAPPAPLPPAIVTDVDLAPSGAYAIVMLRERSTVLRVPIPGGFADPSLIEATVLEGEIVGSAVLSPDERYAFLYTTALDTYKRATIFDLTGEAPPNSIQLRKSVRSVAIAPDGRTALVVHRKLPGDPGERGIDPDEALDRSYGYSLVRLDSGFNKVVATEADVGPFALVPDGSSLFILFNAGPIREVHRADLESFQERPIVLGSPPVSIGSVPGSRKVFVGQEHPDGRITFIDWLTAEAKSVTGFELNSRIRE